MSTGTAPLINAVAFAGANSREFLRAVFEIYASGPVVAMSPVSGPVRAIPGVKITDRRSFKPDSGWFEETYSPRTDDEPAQISFSSGTTGRPKPILLSHRALADVVLRLNSVMQVDSSIREYVGVPINYSFGLGRCRAVSAAGGGVFLPPHGFNPSEIAALLRAGEINAVSAVPTLWRILLANADVIGEAGAKVRWIEIGSQYMSRDEKEAMKRLFPNARIVQHYGLTEASRSTFLDISTVEGEALESVGATVGKTEVDVSTDGRIMLRGPHIADGVVSGAGVKPIADAEGWLTTNDLGEIRDGFLYFKGRADDLINCGGVKIDPEQFQQKLTSATGAPGALAVGKSPDAMRGERVLVAIKSGEADVQSVRDAALKIAGEYGLVGAASLVFAEVDDFPVTATGKLKRADLSKVSASAIAARSKPVATTTVPETKTIASAETDALRKIWAEALGVEDFSIHENFYDLGGDSLSAVTVMLRMKRAGVDPEVAAGILEGKSIAELTGAPSQQADALKQPATVVSPSGVSAFATPGTIARAEDIRKVWQEALGLETIAFNEGFYDLGGDSLSAVTVMLRMERIGVDPDVAKGIFEGATISELVGMPPEANLETAAVPPPMSPEGSAAKSDLTIAGAINAIHASRGVLVTIVVIAHWLPGLLERLPYIDAAAILDAIIPVLRYGTPGFAIVFGLGVGALKAPQFMQSRARFRNGNKLAVQLLFASVLLLGAIWGVERWTAGDLNISGLPTVMFYSAITFYFLISATLGLVLSLVGHGRHVALNMLLLAAACFVLNEVLWQYLNDAQTSGVVNLGRLLLIAKYGYLKMTGAVLVGGAIGYHFRRNFDKPGTIHGYALAGLALFTFGVLAIWRGQPADDLFTVPLVEPWHLMTYTGLTLMILAGFAGLGRSGAPRGLPRLFLNIAVVLGAMALPIYVGHAIVRPIAGILENVGAPGIVALGAPLAAFFGAILWGSFKLYRLFAR